MYQMKKILNIFIKKLKPQGYETLDRICFFIIPFSERG